MQNTEKNRQELANREATRRINTAIETVNENLSSVQADISKLSQENNAATIWGNKLQDKTAGQVFGMLVENSIKADFLQNNPAINELGKDAGADADAYFRNAQVATEFLKNSVELKKLREVENDLFGVRGILREKLDAVNRIEQERRAEDMINN